MFKYINTGDINKTKGIVDKFIFAGNRSVFNCCGIYALRNLANGKFYVGSSKNVYKRISKHIYLLKNKLHDNLHLQQAFDQDKSVFEITLLEQCSIDKTFLREVYWINFKNCINNGYNQSEVSVCGGNIVTHNTRAKISRTLMHDKNLWMCNKHTNEKIVKFESLFEAGKFVVDLSKGTQFNTRIKISEAARNKEISTGHGRKATRSTAYGYKWEVV